MIIKDIMERSGSKAEVYIEDLFPGGRLVGGKYQIHAHAVTMYTGVIKKQCRMLFGNEDRLHDYFKVVFAHEIGHAEDENLEHLSHALASAESESQQQRIALQIEENAWRFAESILEDMDSPFLSKIIDTSLDSYRQALYGSAIQSA
ncbi:hypothetical protein [Bacillus marinisedimentorum]|uniref:hypothetical protein n=1 Tax=Bacillus marinisedimentorum TaxID=1821260 RepID=UPI001FDED44E|nr:hypothetical protein [Bacillus marinisedimentorum]